MAFIMNGVDMSSVIVNGVSMDNVYVNGVLVFTAGWDLSSASYEGITYDFNPPVSNGGDIVFKPDGNKAFISAAGSPDRVYRFSVNTAWNIGTLSDDSNSFDISGQLSGGTGLEIDTTGKKVYVTGGHVSFIGDSYVFQYNLGTAWDLNTGSYSGKFKKLEPTVQSVNGIAFKTDGSRCYFTNSTGIGVEQSIVEYNVGTAWDISTISPTGSRFILPNVTVNSSSVRFSSSGDQMYVLRRGSETVESYTLTIPWVLSSTVPTPTYIKDVSTEFPSFSAPYGMAFKTDGAKMYLHSLSDLYQYSL